MIATSPDLAQIVAKGNKSYGSLSESESLRYGAYVQSFFDNVESYRSLATDYGMDRDLAVLTSTVSRVAFGFPESKRGGLQIPLTMLIASCLG